MSVARHPARIVLYLQPKPGMREALVDVFRRIDIPGHALQQAGRLSVEVQSPPEADAPVLVTALRTSSAPEMLSRSSAAPMARAPTPKPWLTPGGAGGSGQPQGRRLVDFDESGRLETTIYERAEHISGASVTGPAEIEEPASTSVVYPGQRVTLDSLGNLRIEIGA